MVSKIIAWLLEVIEKKWIMQKMKPSEFRAKLIGSINVVIKYLRTSNEELKELE